MTSAEFLARLDGVRESGRGWMAQCPAHEDRNPSLSVAEGDNDIVLVHCFAGCCVDAIAAALGLTVRDLFVGGPAPIRRGREAAETPTTLWAAIRQETRIEQRRLLSLEGEIAGGIFRLHQRVRGIRSAIAALGRDDDKALDLLADAAALEGAALPVEAELDEFLKVRQAADFPHPRQG